MRCIVIPATQEIYLQAIREGLADIRTQQGVDQAALEREPVAELPAHGEPQTEGLVVTVGTFVVARLLLQSDIVGIAVRHRGIGHHHVPECARLPAAV